MGIFSFFSRNKNDSSRLNTEETKESEEKNLIKEEKVVSEEPNESNSGYLIALVPKIYIQKGLFADGGFSIELLEKVRLFDFVTPKIKPIYMDTTELSTVCDTLVKSVFSCGVGFDEIPSKVPFDLVFSSTGSGNVGYTVKFRHLERIGKVSNMLKLDKHGYIDQINYNDPHKYLSQFSQLELEVGERIKEVSERTLVIIMGTSPQDLFVGHIKTWKIIF